MAISARPRALATTVRRGFSARARSTARRRGHRVADGDHQEPCLLQPGPGQDRVARAVAEERGGTQLGRHVQGPLVAVDDDDPNPRARTARITTRPTRPPPSTTTEEPALRVGHAAPARHGSRAHGRLLVAPGRVPPSLQAHRDDAPASQTMPGVRMIERTAVARMRLYPRASISFTSSACSARRKLNSPILRDARPEQERAARREPEACARAQRRGARLDQHRDHEHGDEQLARGRARSAIGSSSMPTETKNRTANRSRNGMISPAAWCARGRTR